MRDSVAAVRRLLTSQQSYLRGVFVLIGSAIALSLLLLEVTLIALLVQGQLPLWAVLVASVPIVVAPLLLGLLPAIRQVEGVAVESLLGVRFPDGPPGPAVGGAQRRRTLWWFLLHLFAGAVVVAAVMGLIVLGANPWIFPAAIGTVLLVLVLGRALTAAAPRLLGPSYAERLHRLEADVARAVGRNRIAREIHDSVGHALSLVTVQAAAARRVIGRDPAFAESALETIEATSRAAVADLDHMLGLLRQDDEAVAARAPDPDLAALPQLLEAARSAGLAVREEVHGDLRDMPHVVSREAYRIVQEGLTNALRYSADGTATLDVVRAAGELRIELANPSGAGSSGRTGRGVRGIAERTALLGGESTAGRHDHDWMLSVTVPVPEERRS